MFHKKKDDKPKKTVQEEATSIVDQAVEESAHIFNDEFREELRNRGRLRFEKAINENSMFLKQDLEMTVSQLNDHLKNGITQKLDAELQAYAAALKDAQELALQSLQRTATGIEEQRSKLTESMTQFAAEREQLLLKVYEENMAKIVEHYILEALGDQFDVKAQLPFIIAQMEANKKTIMDDMRL